jgi:hypothetical protein
MSMSNIFSKIEMHDATALTTTKPWNDYGFYEQPKIISQTVKKWTETRLTCCFSLHTL